MLVLLVVLTTAAAQLSSVVSESVIPVKYGLRRFGENVVKNYGYIVEIENITIAHFDGELNIDGIHDEDKTDDDVNTVYITDSEITQFPLEIASKYKSADRLELIDVSGVRKRIIGEVNNVSEIEYEFCSNQRPRGFPARNGKLDSAGDGQCDD